MTMLKYADKTCLQTESGVLKTWAIAWHAVVYFSGPPGTSGTIFRRQ